MIRSLRSPTGRVIGNAITLSTACAVMLTGCAGGTMTSLPLPFRPGTGDGSYQITVHLADAGRLVPNAEVKAGDITVGSITRIDFDRWTAKLTVGLDDSAMLPANAEARLGQKSLLGAEYLEVSPPTRGPSVGTLRNGDDIPLARTGQYPSTEELLSALSLVLNQGGVSQLQTVTSELNAALGGHEADTRHLIQNLGALVSSLNARKVDMVRTIDNLDRLSGTVARQTAVIDGALRTIPPALAVLEQQRGSLVRTLDSVSEFGAVATPVINKSRDDLAANLRSLQPVLGKLADSGKDLTQSLPFALTFPFPANTSFPNVLNGDYGNLYITVNLDPNQLNKDWTSGLTIAGLPLFSGSSLASGVANPDPLATVLGQPLPVPSAPQPIQTPPNGRSPGGLLGSPFGGGS